MFFKKNIALQDNVVKILFGLAAVGNAVQWYITLRTGVPLASTLPFLSLHYTVYSGVDLVKPWYYLFLYPALGTVILAVNLWRATRVYSHERLLSYLLAVTAFLVEIILAVFLIFLLLINIQAR